MIHNPKVGDVCVIRKTSDIDRPLGFPPGTHYLNMPYTIQTVVDDRVYGAFQNGTTWWCNVAWLEYWDPKPKIPIVPLELETFQRILLSQSNLGD